MSTPTTASPPRAYKALPLSQGQIRILEVAPSSGDHIVECTMERISLLENPVPAYETISYCWGPSQDRETWPTIKLNGHLTGVPPSSEAALKRMRLSDLPRVLWIDAICIDQSSEHERSVQVAFMATVYSRARHNLIYLGENNDAMAERSVKAIQDVMKDMGAAAADLTLLHQITRDGQSGLALFSYKDFSARIDFKALEALFSVPWFRRLWVLQEVVLAPSNSCHWGTFDFELLDTVRAARFLNYKYRFIPRDLYYSNGLRSAFRMFDLCNPDDRFVSNLKSLANMFWMTQQFEKTEPRDGIYAILGLLDQDTSPEIDQAALLRVDYTKPVPDVLRDATRHALCQRGNLAALNMIDHRSDVLDDSQPFPTWTVRADLQRDNDNTSLLPNLFNSNKGLMAPSLLDDASFGGDVLLLEGLAVDEVLQTTATLTRSTWRNDEEYHKWLVSVINLAMHYHNVATREDVYLAIASTLLAIDANGKRAKPYGLQMVVDDLKSLTLYDDGVISDSTRVKPPIDWERIAAIHEDYRLVSCMRRRFFVTAAGRMGIGPRCMQPEDLAVVLRGGRFPYVLRKKVDGYWLLGPAYVHGIMDGEAVQIHKDQGGSEQVFHLR